MTRQRSIAATTRCVTVATVTASEKSVRERKEKENAITLYASACVTGVRATTRPQKGQTGVLSKSREGCVERRIVDGS